MCKFYISAGGRRSGMASQLVHGAFVSVNFGAFPRLPSKAVMLRLLAASLSVRESSPSPAPPLAGVETISVPALAAWRGICGVCATEH